MSKNDDLVRRQVEFLREAATYFEKRPTNGEDKAHWSNVYNAKSCREIADAIERGAAQGAEKKNTSFFEFFDTLTSLSEDELVLFRYGNQDQIDKLLRLLDPPPPAPAPDAGEEWKLVPVQPTEVMALAAYGKQHCRDVYRAMLEAAPSPAPQPPAVEAEAVAWRYKSNVGNENSTWLITQDPQLAETESAYPNIVDPREGRAMTDFESICEAIRRYVANLPTEGGRGSRDSWRDRLDNTLSGVRAELSNYYDDAEGA